MATTWTLFWSVIRMLPSSASNRERSLRIWRFDHDVAINITTPEAKISQPTNATARFTEMVLGKDGDADRRR
jgi:hypothetical protein